MSDSKTVKEGVIAEVVTIKKKGRDGDYTLKVVQVDGKDWRVGKNDDVEVGKEYTFNLSKGEYNDAITYWANLVKEDKKKNKPKAEDKPETEDENALKKKVFAYLDSLDLDLKKKTIIYLLERI